MKTKPKATIEKLKEHLTEAHLAWDGGYPYDSDIIGKRFVVASLNHDGATKLVSYTNRQLKEWVKRANEELLRTDDFDLTDAFFETML